MPEGSTARGALLCILTDEEIEGLSPHRAGADIGEVKCSAAWRRSSERRADLAGVLAKPAQFEPGPDYRVRRLRPVRSIWEIGASGLLLAIGIVDASTEIDGEGYAQPWDKLSLAIEVDFKEHTVKLGE